MAFKIDSDLAKYSTLGIQFALTILFFGWLGTKLDKWLGSAPWGVLCMGTLGFIGGIYSLILTARRYEKKKAERRRSGKNRT
jgi:F0F1-type ATP synthase assembly protein I